MLQNIRESTKSGWTYVLVALLIVVFAVFFGVPGESLSSGAQRRLVAKVGGTDIYNDDVNLVFNRQFSNQNRLSDDQLLQQQAASLKSLILVELLAMEAKELGLRVSDEELRNYVKDPFRNIEFGFYSRDGKYDGKYLQAHIQNRLRVQPQRYDEYKRSELLAIKYMTLIEIQFQGSEAEVKALHDLRASKVDLEFAKFDQKSIAEFVTIDDAAIATFLSTSAADIKKYYDDNAKDYETPEQFQIRRVFVSKPEDEAKLLKAAEKFANAKERVFSKKENFADVAGELSEDYAKEKQGLMDWTDVENIDQNITDALKDAKIGDVKEVETKFAYMLVKLEGKRDAKKTPLADVQNDIAKALLQKKRVRAFTDEMVAEFRTKLETEPDFTAALAALKPAAPAEGTDAEKSKWDAVSVDSTGMFSLEGQDLGALFGNQFPNMLGQRTGWNRVPKIGESTQLATAAFKLTKEAPIDKTTYKVADGSFVVKLKNEEKPTEENMAEKQSELLAEVSAEKRAPVVGNPNGFMFPAADFGDYFETIYDEAVEKGAVKLYEKNYEAIPLVKRKSDKEEEKSDDKTDEAKKES